MSSLVKTLWPFARGAARSAQAPYLCRNCRNRIGALNTRRFGVSTYTRDVRTGEAKSDALAASPPPAPIKFGDDEETPVLGLLEDPPSEAEAPAVETKQQDENPSATSWEDLPRIGSKSWMAKHADPGHEFHGWGPRSKDYKNSEKADGAMEKIARLTFKDAVPAQTAHITDPVQRFRLFEVISRVTGRRIADAEAQRINSLKDVRNAITVPEKPLSLPAELTARGLAALPNVAILRQRPQRRMEDKERGRSKLIREALQAKGLPLRDSAASRIKRRI